MQDKKSNARIAWDEFISNFSLNDKKNISVKPAVNGSAVHSSPVETDGKADESTEFNVRDDDEPEAVSDVRDDDEPETVSDVRVRPPRTTVIGEQVEITGNCKIEGDVEIYGEITGDVQAGGTIVVFGKVTGNMSGKNVLLNAAKVKGSITAQETIELDDSSVVTDGKMVAEKVISNGKTECDMDISEIARFGEKANSSGNINTVRISIEEGAIIKGVVISQ